MENGLGKPLPGAYREFLAVSNGVDLFIAQLAVYGMRFSYDRTVDAAAQPFDLRHLNEELSPDRIPDSWLLIGAYCSDGSRVYADTGSTSDEVFRCVRYEAEVLQRWPDFWTWLLGEAERIGALYDDDGYKIDESQPVVPPAPQKVVDSTPKGRAPSAERSKGTTSRISAFRAAEEGDADRLRHLAHVCQLSRD